MRVFGSPALGSVVDLALSVDWFCPQPCFEKARNTPRIRERIYAGHDRRERDNRANLQAALDETESHHLYLATLPDGLRTSESDIARVSALQGDYTARTLQDPDTIRAAFRLLRNHKRLPYYHSANGKGELWDYDELHARLANLEANNGRVS